MARTYTSDVRAEQSRRTRATVLRAATEMFVEDGWAATTMARVAQRAGVARQTVYLLFDGKLSLLDAAIDEALRGATGSRVGDQAGYLAIGNGSRTERVRAAAAWLDEAHVRSARIQRVLDEAAVTDPAAAVRLAEREENRWQQVRHAATLVLGTEPEPSVVDAVWLLASRTAWLRLVVERGWPRERWREWFATQLTAAIGAGGAPEHAPAPNAVAYPGCS